MAEEKDEVKISKISSLINQAQEDINGMKIVVHYSEDKWKTNEEVELILGEETTIGELIQISKQKFNKPNINNKKLFVRIFKKKKKIPNDEYPLCNPESRVKDYAKDCFCLVEDKNSKKMEKKEEKNEKLEEVKQNTNIGNGGIKTNNNEKDKRKVGINDENEDEVNMYKTCSPKCVSCVIF